MSKYWRLEYMDEERKMQRMYCKTPDEWNRWDLSTAFSLDTEVNQSKIYRMKEVGEKEHIDADYT